MVNRIHIAGAGVSGLVLGYELLKRGHNVHIYEKGAIPGGLAKCENWHNFPIDLGPHIFHTPDSDINEYWKKEFSEHLIARKHYSKNYKNGVYYDYPVSIELIKTFPSDQSKQILSEIESRQNRKPSIATNYHDYMEGLVGPTLQKLFFIQYAEKLWGIPTTELDANWAPKRIKIREQSTSFFGDQWSYVGKEGSGSIINSLIKKIEALGGKITCNDGIQKITVVNNAIRQLHTINNDIDVELNDIVISTLSCTTLSNLLDYKTSLRYRSLMIVFLLINKKEVFPPGVDFFYVDDPNIHFHRTSDHSFFVNSPFQDKTVLSFEIAYSQGDKIDNADPSYLCEQTINQFSQMGLINKKDVLDSKAVKIPEVYPMFFSGYREALAVTKGFFDRISNMYTLGSLAEYAYSDLQILFGKSIDMAEILTNKTLRCNRSIRPLPMIKFEPSVQIEDKWIGDGYPCFTIAEIGLNHNGNMDLAKQLIDEAVKVGADAAKLQSFKAENRVAPSGKTSRYAEKVLGIEETDYEMFKRTQLSQEQTKELFEYARGKILIFSTPFDIESVDELEELEVTCYKIASFDLINIPLLKKVARTGKPMFLSTGMATLGEVEQALNVIALEGNAKVILFHCTSAYPCPPENMNIRAIDTLKTAFKVPVGLSDHVMGDAVSLAAVARGANVIEKHFTLDKRLEGPDHILSLIPDEFESMISRIHMIEEAMGDGIKRPAPNELSTMIRFRKTLYTRKDIQKGEIITTDNIICKGPAYGISPMYLDIVTGQQSLINLKADTPLQWEHIGGVCE